MNYLTVKMIASRCGVQPATVVTWIKRPARPLKATLAGHTYLLDPADFAAFARIPKGRPRKT